MKNKNKRQKHRRYQKLRQTLAVWLLLLPAVIILYLMIWRPSVMGIIWSFFKMNGYTPTKFIGLQNYIRVVSNTEFWPIMFNTVKYVFWSFVIGFIPPILIAFMLNEMLHARSTMRVIIYLPAVLPGITILLLWYFI